MKNIPDSELEKALGQEPYQHIKKLGYLKNHLEAPRPRTDCDTFEFLLEQLPAAWEVCSVHFTNKQDQCEEHDDRARTLHRAWEKDNGRPAFRESLLELLEARVNTEQDSQESQFKKRLSDTVKLFDLDEYDRECLQA
ncbi:MAG: hypothetical protein R6V56_00315, partial [Lentisphaeria bacterium]